MDKEGLSYIAVEVTCLETLTEKVSSTNIRNNIITKNSVLEVLKNRNFHCIIMSTISLKNRQSITEILLKIIL